MQNWLKNLNDQKIYSIITYIQKYLIILLHFCASHSVYNGVFPWVHIHKGVNNCDRCEDICYAEPHHYIENSGKVVIHSFLLRLYKNTHIHIFSIGLNKQFVDLYPFEHICDVYVKKHLTRDELNAYKSRVSNITFGLCRQNQVCEKVT